MPRVMHFEIPSDDPAKSMKFYSEVFGWTFQQFGGHEYWMCKTGEDSESGINGAVMKKMDPNQPMVNSILVDSVDSYCAKVIAAGGEIVVQKMPIDDMGFVAYFKDPDGNITGVAEFNS